MQTTSMNSDGSSIHFGGESSHVDIESHSERPKGRIETKFAKRSNEKATAIANEEGSLEHAEKTDAEYLHYAKQNFE